MVGHRPTIKKQLHVKTCRFHSQQFFKHTPFMAYVQKTPSLKNVPFSLSAIFQAYAIYGVCSKNTIPQKRAVFTGCNFSTVGYKR